MRCDTTEIRHPHQFAFYSQNFPEYAPTCCLSYLWKFRGNWLRGRQVIWGWLNDEPFRPSWHFRGSYHHLQCWVFFLTACDCRYTVQPKISNFLRWSSFHTTILSRISWLIWGAIQGRWVLLRSYQSELRTHAVKKKHQQTRNCELNLVMQTTVFSRHPSFTLLPCRKAQNF